MSPAHPRPTPPSWRRLPRRSARLQLTALYGGLFLVSGAALVSITYILFQRATKYTKPRLPQIPHTPAIKIQGAAFPQLPQALSKLTQDQRMLAKDQYLLSPPGHPQAQGQHQQFGPLPQLARDQHQLADDQHQLARSVSQLAQAVHQVAQAGSVQAAQRAADSHQLLVNSGIALAIVAVLAVFAGWLLAGRMLRPIQTITRAAKRISSTSLHERLALSGPHDELKELGDTLDDLFARLEAAFEAQRHFVANASHELRTPITTERTLLQVALDDPTTTAAAWRSTAEDVLASSDEQTRLLEALLTLASSDSGLDAHETVDLAATVTAALAELQPEITRLAIRVDNVTAPAPLDGDPLLVERLVSNLLNNAILHNHVDGHVEITTAVQDGTAAITVTNTGAHIPAGEVDRLFQPFQRLDPRRAHHSEGHGLGLSIVRAIATAHQATITAHPMPDGGLSVSVMFPQLLSPNVSGK